MAITEIYEKFVQGDDISITLNSDDNVTGYDCESKIESMAGITVATFNTTINPPYEIVLSLDSQDTLAIAAGKYRWNVKIITPGGNVVTIVVGLIEFVETT